ncbi:MAG: hypothetical protein AAF517_16555 [Planctomycetota bacterium]
MRKKLLILAGLVCLFAPLGCNTTEPTFYSWPHHKRRLRKIVDGLHEMHMDIDRIIFDMEPYPVEIDY